MSVVPGKPIDPITVEVIGNALSSIVEEVGEALVRASFSTNIKERRGCSTALFDTSGAMLCQAEHIPMHLGSFIGIIPEILRRHPERSLASEISANVLLNRAVTYSNRLERSVWFPTRSMDSTS